MNNKEKYKRFCEIEQIPIFSQDWWLDLVCDDGEWDVVLIEKNNSIIASMPYYLKSKATFKLITMPKLTQTMGPYVVYPEGQKYPKKLSYEKEIFNRLIDQLPNVDYFNQNFHPSITNWLPFYWRGYSQTTRYTYCISDNYDINTFQSKIKTDIKKSNMVVEVKSVNHIESLWSCLSKSYERQNKKCGYQKVFLDKLDNGLKAKIAPINLIAIDKSDNIHAAIYCVYDVNKMYYLVSGGDPKLRTSGATSLLIYNAIKIAKEKQLIYDFEGSMVQPIESFIRGFGPKQTSYFQIKKFNSKTLKVFNYARDIFR